MKAQKRFKTLCFVLPVVALLILIGFPMISIPIKVTFDMYPGEEASDYFGERVFSISAGAGKTIKLPTPIRPQREIITTDGRKQLLPEYVFKGWSKDKNGKKMVGSTAKSSMKLYAIWAEFEPTASLYVDGIYLRDALIPTPAGQGATAGSTLGALGSAFKPETSWKPSILEAYNMDEFFGWWYLNNSGRRCELRWDTDNRWYHYNYNTATRKIERGMAVNTQNPYAPRYDVALNAMFGTRHDSLPTATGTGVTPAKNTGKYVTIRFQQPSGTILEYRDTYKYGDTIVLNSGLNVTYPSGGNKLGWKVDIDTDPLGDIFRFGDQFYISPQLFEKNRFELVFNAVTVTSSTQYSGVWDKQMQNGKVTLVKKQDSVSTTINEFQAYKNPVLFDYSGGRKDVKDITRLTQEQLAAGAKFPNAAASDLSEMGAPERITTVSSAAVAYDTGKVALPFPDAFAIAGGKFGGWKCNINGQIYGAGLDFIIPRGYAGELQFTAVWVNI